MNPNTRTGKVINVPIPFEPLTTCPECGLPVQVDIDRVFDAKPEEGSGLVRIARYTCTNGHVETKRQVIMKKIQEESS